MQARTTHVRTMSPYAVIPRYAVLALAVLVAGGFLSAVPADAGVSEGRIDAVHIVVWDMPDKDELGIFEPGDTIDVDPGQNLMIRIIVKADDNPADRRQYVEAEHWVERGEDNVRLSKHDKENGSVNVAVLERGAGSETTLRYRLVRGVQVGERDQTSSTLRLRIRGRSDRPGPGPGPRPDPNRGATLYEDDNFRGDSQLFRGDHPDLRATLIGNDRASSIRVSRGCTARLYEDTNYRGRETILLDDIPDLGRTGAGNDRASSIRVSCEERDDRGRGDRRDRRRDG